jgi:hypothetical protein
MSKHIEKLKKQLIEISEVVNSFRSEAVQVRVVDKLLEALLESEKIDGEGTELFNKRGYKHRGESENGYVNGSARLGKKPGATKVLNQLLSTDFFDVPHSISSIADYCKENFDSEFKTSELSGILLKLANEGKLRRERSNENNRFEYVRT